ncbi:hypothetical protein ACTMU2_17670 [Cupriavidus basilensis]
MVLVRPDGQVAWRGDYLPADLHALLDRVRGASDAPAPEKSNVAVLAEA